MKALTIHQPHASLLFAKLASGFPIKRAETRSWAPPFSLAGADIAIHASARKPAAAPDEMRGAALPTGCVIGVGRGLLTWRVLKCIGELSMCRPWNTELDRRDPGPFLKTFLADRFGDWSEGRFIWTWREMWPLPEPVPAKGQQRLWDWTP